MAIQPVGSSPAQAVPYASEKQQTAEELTTVTTHCDKRHQHDQSCPHTVTTRPAPRPGEVGYLFERIV